MDQIVRQKFENFEPEPPLTVWENVRSNISQTPPPAPSGLMLPILFIVTFLLFIGGLVLNLLTGNEKASGPEGEMAESHLKTAGMISTGSTTGSAQSLQNAIYQTYQENHLEQVMTNNTPAVITPSGDEPIRVKAPFEPYKAPARQKITSPENGQSAQPSTANRGSWTPGLRQALASGEITVGDAVKYNLDLRDIRKLSRFQSRENQRNASWSIGVFFNPEVTNHKPDDLENTVSYNFSLMPQVSFGHFFLQSGINARLTTDRGNATVNYNRFLGTYDDVYLVTFDSTENGVIPTYHTQQVEVYDTIDHYAISETTARYTYLEVPVMLGYRYEAGRFTLFAKGGPSASFLVHKDIPAQAPEENARIVNVNYQVPARTQVNWQLVVGAGLDYKLFDKLSLSLEPTFRYALNPEYELPEDAVSRSYSFGFRAGLNYKIK
jgi:hypothetical protein